MFTMLMHTESDEEKKLLRELVKEVTALISDEKVNIIYDVYETDSEPECAIVNICDEGKLEYAKDIRSRYPNIELMLISNGSISPMKYLNPQIRPLSLAIVPYGTNEIKEVIRDFLHKVIAVEEGGMWIDTYDGKIKVNYNSILYLEATNKMLRIRLDSVEYSIYGSLEKLEKDLPEVFVRCHRSYIVNTGYISKVRYSENYIQLKNQVQIPMSRSHKQVIKEVLEHGTDKEILS